MEESETPEPLLLSIGDIGVSQHWIITPNGTKPLKNTLWIVKDNTTKTTRMPPYAIVLAIVFAVFCFIGLLFLLIKEETLVGNIEVQVQNEKFFHVTQIPVNSLDQINQIRAQVAQAQTLTAAL